jgi:hypothetical protein
MMARFLVGAWHHGWPRDDSASEWARGDWFLVDADSRDDVTERFSGFEQLAVTDLQHERPSWLTDSSLAALSEHWLYRLGDSEPGWLSRLLDHLVSGDEYRWYRLLERPAEGDGHETRLGDYGSWSPKGPGSVLLLGRRMVVAAVHPAEAAFEATLVLVAA